MKARIDSGWLVVGPYDGPDLAPCYIGTGSTKPIDWRPAYKGWRGAERVLQVRPPDILGGYRVWVKVCGAVRPAGTA